MSVSDQIRCICGITDDDGYSIQCETCFVWQHVECVLDGEKEPELYYCEQCKPRNMDVTRAVGIQMDNRRKAKTDKPRRSYVRKDKEQRISPKKPKRKERDSRFSGKDDEDLNLTSPTFTKRSIKEDQDQNSRKSMKPFKKKADFGVESPGSLDDDNPTVLQYFNERNAVSFNDSSYNLENNKSPTLFSMELDAILDNIKDYNKNFSSENYLTRDGSSIKFDDLYQEQYQMYKNDRQFAFSNRFLNRDIENLITAVCKKLQNEILQISNSVGENENSSVLPWGGKVGWTFFEDSPEEKCEDNLNFHPIVIDQEAFESILGLVTVEEIEYSDTDQSGLFCTSNIVPKGLISEINGTLSFFSDVGGYIVNNEFLKEGNYTDKPKFLIPPYVFMHPAKIFSRNGSFLQNQVVVDSRKIGSADGRFVRSYCGGDPMVEYLCNAELRTVFIISQDEEGDTSRSKLNYLKPWDQLKLCIFSTKLIKATEEVVIDCSKGPYNVLYHSCVCKNEKLCIIKQARITPNCEAVTPFLSYELQPMTSDLKNVKHLEGQSNTCFNKLEKDVGAMKKIWLKKLQKESLLKNETQLTSPNNEAVPSSFNEAETKYRSESNKNDALDIKESNSNTKDSNTELKECIPQPKKIRLGEYLESRSHAEKFSDKSLSATAQSVTTCDATNLPDKKGNVDAKDEAEPALTNPPVNIKKVVSLKDFMLKKGLSLQTSSNNLISEPGTVLSEKPKSENLNLPVVNSPKELEPEDVGYFPVQPFSFAKNLEKKMAIDEPTQLVKVPEKLFAPLFNETSKNNDSITSPLKSTDESNNVFKTGKSVVADPVSLPKLNVTLLNDGNSSITNEDQKDAELLHQSPLNLVKTPNPSLSNFSRLSHSATDIQRHGSLDLPNRSSVAEIPRVLPMHQHQQQRSQNELSLEHTPQRQHSGHSVSEQRSAEHRSSTSSNPKKSSPITTAPSALSDVMDIPMSTDKNLLTQFLNNDASLTKKFEGTSGEATDNTKTRKYDVPKDERSFQRNTLRSRNSEKDWGGSSRIHSHDELNRLDDREPYFRGESGWDRRNNNRYDRIPGRGRPGEFSRGVNRFRGSNNRFRDRGDYDRDYDRDFDLRNERDYDNRNEREFESRNSGDYELSSEEGERLGSPYRIPVGRGASDWSNERVSDRNRPIFDNRHPHYPMRRYIDPRGEPRWPGRGAGPRNPDNQNRYSLPESRREWSVDRQMDP
ncbi:myeloid lymphoid or mixed-lineage leukemia 5 (trithorax, ) [Clydaea vesicula]|uniref:Myeloid lymphoid or mixed-lineage leukemia 5 (Trithorax, ) n=1 Tax=Clydaea vesicula TaxID=447962 RepID=A0AAD5U2B6_9FUNG|nr:myeloid lymphoid or mixed-lineage leukemia 5 (trithorax, ) [Clydaea vesicula]